MDYKMNITKYGELPSTISIRVREPGSAFTHGIALIFTLIGMGPLIMRAGLYGSRITLISMWIFILSMVLLYGASTMYHSVVSGERITRILRKLDHMNISILIAGTYTPVCLLALRGKTGIRMLIAIWVLALAGILLKLFWISCPKWISSTLYLGMGWLCIAAFPAILASLSTGAFLWLLAGGILYSVGAVIYAMKLSVFNNLHIYFGSHEIFHLFIMAGSFCHYIVMYCFLAYR